MNTHNRHTFRPYPDAHWGGMLLLFLMGLGLILCESAFGRFLWMAFFAVFAARCFWASLTTVEVSDTGIRICQWRYETVPETRWEDFCQAYLLDVSWTQRAKYVSSRFVAYYLLLTNQPIRLGDVREAGIKMAGARPCGKWRGHTALRLKEEYVPIIRECIGDKLPLTDKRIDGDDPIRL